MSAEVALRHGLAIAQKYSPQILTAAGIAGVVVAGVWSTMKGRKLDIVMTAHNGMRNEVEKRREDDVYANPEQDYPKDVARVYTQTTMDLVKLYWKPALLGALSLTAIVAGHGITIKRNVALTAAYAALDQGFRAYRQRVIEEVGPEKEKELRIARVEQKQLEGSQNADLENTTQPINRGNETYGSIYARYFDTSNSNWDDYTTLFLRNQQDYFNDRLRTHGHVFLNEVYRRLGFKETPEGQAVGWLWNKETGDNYIDFGVDDWNLVLDEAKADKEIFLDFNVDGTIWDKI